jgi:peptidoglycan/xylan/chitin deacetylase (PgdA/CDA1 family)
MAVAVLMYHGTPRSAVDEWDVSLPCFREQVDRLFDAGFSFIPFGSVHQPDLLARGRHVAVTFDDGERSNIGAIEYLHALGVRPTAFIVREWAEKGSGPKGSTAYLDRGELLRLAEICDFGAHGATHMGMTELAPPDLDKELHSSRDFLQQQLGRPVDRMALPGGLWNAAVLYACHRHGFSLVGNSIVDINRSVELSVNRIVIAARHAGDYPLRMAGASAAYWALRRLRRRILDLANDVAP